MARVSAYARERGILKLLDNIQSAGKSASDIVANMLSFSRKPDQEKRTCRLDRVVEKALALAGNDFQLKKQYDFRNIRISTSCEPNLPPIQCVETKIQQVLLNLFKNAAQAMVSQANDTAAPAIEIRLFREKADLCLTVSDNGPGMDESIRKRIFEPFFTTKPVDSGTGLGLSISYFIVTEDHGGQMDVRSAPGQGTEFIIRLPLD